MGTTCMRIIQNFNIIKLYKLFLNKAILKLKLE